MKHHLRSLSLAALTLFVGQSLWAYDFVVDGIYYHITSADKQTVEVTYETSDYNSYSGEVTIPSEVPYDGKTYQVTSIGSSAFRQCTGLTSVLIPEGVTNIGYEAFRESETLTSVSMPNSVSAIGGYAFYECRKLKDFTIPSGVTSIGGSAFCMCSSLTSVVIPSGVKSFGFRTFWGCSQLSSVTLPDGFLSIGDQTFCSCSRLTSIILPESVTSIGESAFSSCGLTSITIPSNVNSIGSGAFNSNPRLTSIIISEDNPYFKMEDDIMYSKDKTHLILCLTSKEGTYSIPETVVNISADAFRGCSKLTLVELPSGLTSIEHGTFLYCSGLKSVTIPQNVTSIGYDAFSGCTGPMCIVVPTGVTSIGSSAFREVRCIVYAGSAEGSPWGAKAVYTTMPDENGLIYADEAKTQVLAYVGAGGDVVIPDGVTSIAADVFKNIPSVTSVSVPESVTAIGENAFLNVPAVYYSGTAEGSPWGALAINPLQYASMDDFEFEDEEKTIIKKYIGAGGDVVIPEGIVKIGRDAFKYCSEVASVTLPSSVVTIDYGAFWGCYNMTRITMPYGVKNIGSLAFYMCYKLEDFDLPESIETISTYAFQLCTELTKMVIPASATKIEGGLFVFSPGIVSLSVSPDNPIYDSRDNCNAIIETATNTLVVGCKTTVIPTNIKSIGKNAFYGTPDLEQVMIPEGVTSIGSYAYGECRKVKSVSIPSSVDSIGTGAFTFITDIESITVAADNPIYDSRNNCNAIIKTASNILLLGCQNTVIPEGIVTIADQAFCGASMLEFSVPEGVTRLESQAFSRCEKMQRISLPESVNFIGNSAFFTCYKLEDIVIPESVTEIKDFAFSSCTSLTEIAVPNKVKRLEGGIFKNCSQLKKVTLGYRLENVNYSAFEKCSSLSALYANSPVPPSVNKKFTDIDMETCVLYVPAAYIDAYREAEVWKEFAHIEVNPNAPEPIFLITYEVDGEVVQVDSVKYGDAINLMEAPSKEGFIFSGWSGYPENLTMPAADIVISGSFSVDGIEHIAGDDAPASVTYDMYGRQVVAPQPGTLYLRGNRKLIAR